MEPARHDAIKAALAELTRHRTQAEQQKLLQSQKIIGSGPGTPASRLRDDVLDMKAQQVHPQRTPLKQISPAPKTAPNLRQTLSPVAAHGPPQEQQGVKACTILRREDVMLQAVNNSMAMYDSKVKRRAPATAVRLPRLQIRQSDRDLFEDDVRVGVGSAPQISSRSAKRLLC